DVPGAVAGFLEEGRSALAGLVVLLNLGMAAVAYAAFRYGSRPVSFAMGALLIVGTLLDRLVIETTDMLPSVETISLAIHDRAQASAFLEHFVGGGMVLRLLAMASIAALALYLLARRRRPSKVATM